MTTMMTLKKTTSTNNKTSNDCTSFQFAIMLMLIMSLLMTTTPTLVGAVQQAEVDGVENEIVLSSSSLNHRPIVPGSIRGITTMVNLVSNDLQDDGNHHVNATSTVERRLDHTKTCKLKLYWKEGYEWQEERFERKWCVQNSDGRAKIKKCRDTSRQKWILNEDDNTIRMKNDDDKCLEVRNNRVYVKDCKSSGSARDRQKFDFDIDDSKFEIRRAGRCMTQQHHPRENEKLKMQRCGVARRDDTSLWECD